MRKIMVVTGTRAEYGILKPVLYKIKNDRKLELSLLVTGMHLSHEYGYTIQEIEQDGFQIDSKIDMLLSEDTKESMAKSLAIGILGMVEAIKKIKPDIVLVCGDRSEPFAATISAAYTSIPVAHIFGGDMAIGSNIDDSIRHAITKFAHIHFVATKTHLSRIIKMGEESWRVYCVGSPAIDTIMKEKTISPKEIAKTFDIDLKSPLILAIQHPTTTNAEHANKEMKETLDALKELGHQTILIYPNADAGGKRMIDVIKKYEKYPFLKTYKSLGQSRYLSLMKIADVMIGNSSSGIVEAPSFHLPVVNIGIRQKGREREKNIIDVDHNKKDIIKGIKKALYDGKFKEKIKKIKNLYGDGKSSDRILKILKEVKIDGELLQKKMAY